MALTLAMSRLLYGHIMSIRLNEILPDWVIELKSKGLAPTTINSYLLAAKQLGSFLDDPPITEIKRLMIQAYLVEVLETRASATARQRYASLTQLFKWLYEEDIIGKNPMSHVRPPKVVEKPVDVLTEFQIKLLLDDCEDTFTGRRDQAIIMMFWNTGIRLHELVELITDDIDIAVDFFFVTGKGNKTRQVPWDIDTRKSMSRYLRVRRTHKDWDSPRLWLGAKGPILDSAINQMFARRSSRIGLSRIHPHQFRHTFAHEWMMAGGSETGLMKVAGWTSMQMVQRYGSSAAVERSQAEYFRLRKDRK